MKQWDFDKRIRNAMQRAKSDWDLYRYYDFTDCEKDVEKVYFKRYRVFHRFFGPIPLFPIDKQELLEKSSSFP